MKALRSIIITAVLALFSINSFAQECAPADSEQAKENRNEWIQNEKIAYFTSEIDLTPEEAQQFWPIYNKYWKEATAAHGKTMQALYNIKKNKDKVSTEEMEKLVNAYIKAVNTERLSFTRYFSEFKKILPIEKVGKLYVAEEMFKRKMIHKLRNAQNQKESSKDGQKKNKPNE